MVDVFVSYARANELRVEQLVIALQAHDLKVWWDRSLENNTDFGAIIDEKIDEASVVIVCWSDQAARSQWVKAEATRARHQNKYLGALFEPCMPPSPFNALNHANFENWNGEADGRVLLTLFRDVGRMCGRDDLTKLADIRQHNLDDEQRRRRAAKEAERVKREAIAFEKNAAEEVERVRRDKAALERRVVGLRARERKLDRSLHSFVGKLGWATRAAAIAGLWLAFCGGLELLAPGALLGLARLGITLGTPVVTFLSIGVWYKIREIDLKDVREKIRLKAGQG